jgi:hypothetical protein
VVQEATLSPVADAAAALLASGLAQTAGREALRQARYGRTAAETIDAVDALLDGLSDRALRDTLGGTLSQAQNAGRLATLAVAPKARYYGDETIDGNACQPCADIDGVELPTLDAANLAYGGGGYLFCEGGDRCRGTMRAVWETEDS